jgi:hypothetical protein
MSNSLEIDVDSGVSFSDTNINEDTLAAILTDITKNRPEAVLDQFLCPRK